MYNMHNVHFAHNASVLKFCKIAFEYSARRMHAVQNKCMPGCTILRVVSSVVVMVAPAWRNLSTIHVVVQTTAFRKEIYLCGRLGGGICEYVGKYMC